MGNRNGLFVMFSGGFGWPRCCSKGGCTRVSVMFGDSSWLSEMYCVVFLVCEVVGVFDMGLGSCGCILDGKTIFLLCLMCFFLV